MTLALYRFPNDTDATVFTITRDPVVIREDLGRHRITFERVPISGMADPLTHPHTLEMLHGRLIEGFLEKGSYQSFDFIGVDAEHPAKADLREMFLAEHIHTEDEARLFLHGGGMFAFHVQNSVFLLVTERGTLLCIPAGVRHWFDMGPTPDFTVLRMFNNADGWVPHYTGDAIAGRYRTIDSLAAQSPVGPSIVQRTRTPASAVGSRDPTVLIEGRKRRTV